MGNLGVDRRILFNRSYRNSILCFRLDSCNSEQGPLAGYYENVTEILSFLKRGKFFDDLRYHPLLKDVCEA